ncbi:glutathione transferase GstA [Rhodoferax fermentans]|uniref:Glutathione transferase GstA n=1 Tax=Rhodoferax fermentans TaxID=28066 RepID=A0A1T1AYE3_RHOFE|nr:glutathione transferase GstA [Rhodoferax fermentans]MBK1684272.1 glutathione transferase GstA [Rhodoferax fermentans]OOV09057.1 glutathione transferase GstA [Rhodoferax fermentans]
MKLYYSAGACSLATHIAMKETGLAFEAVSAPTKTHRLEDGTDYYSINPLGYVPLLVLDDGKQLHEVAVILQYLADLVPERQLAPANGTFERYKLQEWLNFIATELHKGFSPLFTPNMPDEAKELAKTRLHARLQWVDGELNGKNYLMGEVFTVADAYLFVVQSWSKYVGVDVSALVNLSAFATRVAARPAVQAAMRAEALLK